MGANEVYALGMGLDKFAKQGWVRLESEAGKAKLADLRENLSPQIEETGGENIQESSNLKKMIQLIRVLDLVRQGGTDAEYSEVSETQLVTLFEALARQNAEGEADSARELAFFGPQHEKISQESFYSRKFRALHAVMNNPEYNQDPRAAYFLQQLEDMCLQDGQMIDPGVLMESVANTIWREQSVPPQLRDSSLSGLNYTLSFYWNTRYETAVRNNLNFEDHAHFARTGEFLELLEKLYWTGSSWSFSEGRVPVVLESLLLQVTEQGRGSYLLNARAQDVLSLIRGDAQRVYDRGPFRLASGVSGWFFGDGLHIAHVELEDARRLLEAAQSAETAQEHRVALANIEKTFVHHISTTDVGLPSLGAEESEQLMHEFGYMLEKPLRETIERDFNITLSNLTLEDQFHLLMFLKTVEKKDASPLFLEATRLLRKRGALNLLEVRGSSMEVTTGQKLEEKDKETIRSIQENHYGEKYPAGLMQELRDGLERAFASSHSRFYLYRHEGNLATCVRFDDPAANDNNRGKHMGSFMTSPKFERGSLGQALLESAIQQETVNGASLFAECDPELVPFYEKFGFKLLHTDVEQFEGREVKTSHITLQPESEERPLPLAA